MCPCSGPLLSCPMSGRKLVNCWLARCMPASVPFMCRPSCSVACMSTSLAPLLFLDSPPGLCRGGLGRAQLTRCCHGQAVPLHRQSGTDVQRYVCGQSHRHPPSEPWVQHSEWLTPGHQGGCVDGSRRCVLLCSRRLYVLQIRCATQDSCQHMTEASSTEGAAPTAWCSSIVRHPNLQTTLNKFVVTRLVICRCGHSQPLPNCRPIRSQPCNGEMHHACMSQWLFLFCKPAPCLFMHPLAMPRTADLPRHSVHTRYSTGCCISVCMP